MMNSLAAVTAAALCAGASVGLFPISTSAPPGAAPAMAAPGAVSAAADEMQRQPISDWACIQGWPYYPAECLRGGNQPEAVRVIPLARNNTAADRDVRVLWHRS